jgi:hypothetical protein
VGASTSTRGWRGGRAPGAAPAAAASSSATAGIAKPSVFPLPVRERTTTSRPPHTARTVAACTGNRPRTPARASRALSCGDSRSENAASGVASTSDFAAGPPPAPAPPAPPPAAAVGSAPLSALAPPRRTPKESVVSRPSARAPRGAAEAPGRRAGRLVSSSSSLASASAARRSGRERRAGGGAAAAAASASGAES